MNKVYRHKSFSPDEYLGHVEQDGKVYEAQMGPDKYIGHVELETGKIFESRLGPDKYIGKVESDTGKVYLGKFGPDEYIGKVNKNGKIYQHRPVVSDEYIGKVIEMVSVIHGGAAFLLLVLPAYDEAVEKKEETDLGDAETGQAPAPA